MHEPTLNSCKIRMILQRLGPALAPASRLANYTRCAALSGAAAAKYWANQTPTMYRETDVERWMKDFGILKAYRREEIARWRNAFDLFDRDGDGLISNADLRKNPNLSVQKVKMLEEAYRDTNQRVDFGEFVNMMSQLDVLDMRRFFSGFDPVDLQLEFAKFSTGLNSAGRRTMTIDHLKDLMQYCDCTCVTDSDAARLMQEIDTNNDGVIDHNEFLAGKDNGICSGWKKMIEEFTEVMVQTCYPYRLLHACLNSCALKIEMASYVGVAAVASHFATQKETREWLMSTKLGQAMMRFKSFAERYIQERPALHDFIDRRPAMAALAASAIVWIAALAVVHIMMTIAFRFKLLTRPPTLIHPPQATHRDDLSGSETSNSGSEKLQAAKKTRRRKTHKKE